MMFIPKSHPMREHEKKYIDSEVTMLENEKEYYFRSGWNYYDWFINFLLLLCIILHIVPVAMYELNRGSKTLTEVANEVGLEEFVENRDIDFSEARLVLKSYCER